MLNQPTTLDYNPIVELFDKYVNNRFEGNCEEQCFLEALVEVQMEMLKKYAGGEEKVKWLRKLLADKNLKPQLEIEYALQRTKIARTMH